MASSGIRRKVDDLGRVVIPAGIRRSLNIREGDAVEVTVEGERVVISRPRDACVFCGREEDHLRNFRGRLVCRDCLEGLGILDERLRAVDAADAPTPARTATPTPAATPNPAATPTPAAVPTPEGTAATMPPATMPSATPAPSAPSAPATPSTPAPATDEPSPRTSRTPWERTRGPATMNGPIDGDAYARGRTEEPAPRRRRPPQDPASTTAW